MFQKSAKSPRLTSAPPPGTTKQRYKVYDTRGAEPQPLAAKHYYDYDYYYYYYYYYYYDYYYYYY